MRPSGSPAATGRSGLRARESGIRAVAWGRLGCGVLVLLLGIACRTPDPQRGLAEEWAEGPAGWLLLPEERDAIERLRPGEWPLFLERFWARRSALAPLFAARVAAADQLYAEAGVRGALTDRGGALILLGEPRQLRLGEVTVPSPRGRDGGRRSTRLPSETWLYEVRDLAPGLRDRLEEEEELVAGAVELVFLSEGRRTRMVYGRTVLVLAARAWVDSDSGGPDPPPARSRSAADSPPPANEPRRDSR